MLPGYTCCAKRNYVTQKPDIMGKYFGFCHGLGPEVSTAGKARSIPEPTTGTRANTSDSQGTA